MLNEHLGNDRVGGSGLYDTIRINFEASTSAWNRTRSLNFLSACGTLTFNPGGRLPSNRIRFLISVLAFRYWRSRGGLSILKHLFVNASLQKVVPIFANQLTGLHKLLNRKEEVSIVDFFVIFNQILPNLLSQRASVLRSFSYGNSQEVKVKLELLFLGLKELTPDVWLSLHIINYN